MITPTSQFQKTIAQKLGVVITANSFAVAAAEIEAALGPALFSNFITRPSSQRQIAFASALGIDVSRDSMRIASIRIQEQLDEKNLRMIVSMGLEPGMRVKWKKWGSVMTISSIAENGRLWFKGGNGKGAFPHEIEMV